MRTNGSKYYDLLLISRQIYESLPKKKQVCAFSATFPKPLRDKVSQYMHHPQFVSLTDEKAQSLKGVKEYYIESEKGTTIAQTFLNKKKTLIQVLRRVMFHQCVVFCSNSSK